MSHGSEREYQSRLLAPYQKREFHKGSAKDRAAPESQRLRRYRERVAAIVGTR